MKESLGTYTKRLIKLFESPLFISLTVIGNSVILLFSAVFFLLEIGVNPQVNRFLDAVWWAFTTVTTVGFGDVVPETAEGRVLGIFLMLLGTGLFATYTALFANALLGREVLKLDKKVKIIDKHVVGMQFDMAHEEINIEKTLARLNQAIQNIEKKLDKLEDKEKK